MRASNLYFELALLVLCMVMATFNLVLFTNEVNNPLIAYTEDKSAVDAENAIYQGEVGLTGADLLMSLTNIDAYTPYPRSIQINDTGIIDLNNDFVTNKYVYIQMLYNGGGKYGSGLKTWVNWTVTSVEYVPNNGDPYIRYVLEAV